MRYRVQLTELAKQQFTPLAPTVKRRIKEGIRTLAVDPRLGKPLKNTLAGYWRFRAQQYRIMYRILEEQRLVEAVFIGHRRDFYRIVADALKLMEHRARYTARKKPSDGFVDNSKEITSRGSPAKQK